MVASVLRSPLGDIFVDYRAGRSRLQFSACRKRPRVEDDMQL